MKLAAFPVENDNFIIGLQAKYVQQVMRYILGQAKCLALTKFGSDKKTWQAHDSPRFSQIVRVGKVWFRV